MGELKETFESNKVSVTLKSFHSSRKLQHLPVHTKERLTSMTKTAQLSEAGRNLIRSLRVTIAQSDLSSSEVSPDLLIGQDLLNVVLDHSASTLKLSSGLILTSTIFGYTIFGTGEAVLKSKETEATCSLLVVATPAVTSARDDYNRDTKHLYELVSLGLNTKGDSNEAEMIRFMEDYRKTINIKNGGVTAGFNG
ncbi:hypothetical protein OESDEN_00264 [Oesophagostomum dentatum]|uniref:Uncharacterized protein n=1 Tax=Oesophagostomum dentatum TaxID=61180 RepID=A0A0B1TWC8_OESDE|nr:hypothetical protein OESDEN_00264 [Oesophagostomum dentatum]